MAITPRARSAASSEASLLSAPRSLNELVTCRFSYLTIDLGAGERRKLRRRQHRRAQHGAVDRAPRRLRYQRVSGSLFDPRRRPFSLVLQSVFAGQRGPLPLRPAGFFFHFGRAKRGIADHDQSEPKRIGVSIEVKPHAYDPATNPELFDGVLARRVVAFLIDLIILAIPVVFPAMFIFVFGIVTLRSAGLLFCAAAAGDRDLGAGLLRPDLRQPAFGHDRHAGHGSRNAHLVRRAGLFRARRHACARVLDHGFGAHRR